METARAAGGVGHLLIPLRSVSCIPLFGGTASRWHPAAHPHRARNRSTWSNTSNNRDPFLIRAAWGTPAGMK
jgi:hypothetical protein